MLGHPKVTAKVCAQGLKVLHDCGWGHMNLKPSKVQVRVDADGTHHCTIVDLLPLWVGFQNPSPCYWLTFVLCRVTQLMGAILKVNIALEVG